MTKRRKITAEKAKNTSYVCFFKEDDKQGMLEHRVIGDARFDPKSLADIDRNLPDNLKRPSSKAEVINDPILPPGLIRIEPEPFEPA